MTTFPLIEPKSTFRPLVERNSMLAIFAPIKCDDPPSSSGTGKFSGSLLMSVNFLP